MNVSGALFPSLHHRRGAQARQRAASKGVAASSKKWREATEPDAAGVVFLFVLIRKTTPASLSADASRHFIDCSATPCGDTRRGIRSRFHYFTVTVTSWKVSRDPSLAMARNT